MSPELSAREVQEALPLEEKKRFILATLPELAAHTFPFLCSVIGILDKQTGRHLGSGLRCTLRGRRAILTALHVVERANAEPSGFAITAGYGRPPFIVAGKIDIDPVTDLAVYFLPDDYPNNSDCSFWPSDRMDREQARLSTDYLFLHGFPGCQSHSSQLLQGVVSRSLPYGAMQRIEDLPSDLGRFQFAIEYDPEGLVHDSGLVADLVDPHGLSGSPVWRLGISGRSARQWSPSDSLLVGIVTQWRPDHHVLVATSVSVLPPTW